MTEMFERHKKLFIAVGVLIGVVLLGIYLHAIFQPGIWHEDVFLYDEGDGIFAGSDYNASYQMEMVPGDSETTISFSVNDTSKTYRIVTDGGTSCVQIYEDGGLVFQGQARSMGDGYMLEDSNGDIFFDIRVETMNHVPTVHELYPAYIQLYTWAVEEKHDVRGNPNMLAVIALLAVMLGLDIAFPNLFFILDHRLDVDGGEPSDWYRMKQQLSRVIIGIAIVVCLFMSFAMH